MSKEAIFIKRSLNCVDPGNTYESAVGQFKVELNFSTAIILLSYVYLINIRSNFWSKVQ